MEDLICDLHIHSRYSHDSLLSPKGILKQAHKVGLTGLAITDHSSLRGGLEAKKWERVTGVRVIIGTEIRTDIGDIIGLDICEEIHGSQWEDVIREIKDQGGTTVLPHPFRWHERILEAARKVDLIEVWNGRCTGEENRKATEMALALGKKSILGSDAHMYSEIGNVRMVLDLTSWTVDRILRQAYASPWSSRSSQIIGHIKAGEIGKLLTQGSRFLLKRVEQELMG